MSAAEDIHGGEASSLWPEDTVEYRIYTTATQDDLTKLAVECTHFAKQRTRGHLWNYGTFALQVRRGGPGYPAHLHGRTCFRDNIEDEWLIVSILFALSKHNANLVISVADGDGEFLLIQSAHHLPKWLKPETATNRVYIRNGQLHIIPKPSSPADIVRLPVAMLTIEEAIKVVTDPTISTVASERVQSSIQSKIERFSGSLDFLYHRANVHLPLPAAHVISHDPQLLAAAVHALCDRDPTDSSLARRNTLSILSPLTHSSVTVCIPFTKLLYAKLVHEQYSPPRNCGFTVLPLGDPQHGSHDLGMKLTCGLEMLVGREGVSSLGPEGILLSEGGERWSAFVASLKEKGYFRGELEGSKVHQLLMTSAKEYFVQSSKMEATEEKTEDARSTAGRRVAHIAQNVPYTEEELREKWTKLPPPDENEDWLELTPQLLEEMLTHSAGYPSGLGAESYNEDHTERSKVTEESGELDLQSLVFGMRSFVDKVSSHTGAEFPWSVDEPSTVNFDPDSFLSTLQSMLGESNVAKQPSPDPEDSLSDDDLSISSEEGVASDEEGAASDEEGGASEEGRPSIAELMADMDLELANTELGKSFEKAKIAENRRSEEREENLQPVDVDLNLVKNLLDSYSSQGGGAGPASNILSSLGVHVPEQSHDN